MYTNFTKGPVMAYLKKVSDATIDTGIGGGWFKISEAGLNPARKSFLPLKLFIGLILCSTRMGRHRSGIYLGIVSTFKMLTCTDQQQGLPRH